MNIASCILVALLILGFLRMLYYDINGRPALPPYGFIGVIITFIIYGILASLYWAAGILG